MQTGNNGARRSREPRSAQISIECEEVFLPHTDGREISSDFRHHPRYRDNLYLPRVFVFDDLSREAKFDFSSRLMVFAANVEGRPHRIVIRLGRHSTEEVLTNILKSVDSQHRFIAFIGKSELDNNREVVVVFPLLREALQLPFLLQDMTAALKDEVVRSLHSRFRPSKAHQRMALHLRATQAQI